MDNRVINQNTSNLKWNESLGQKLIKSNQYKKTVRQQINLVGQQAKENIDLINQLRDTMNNSTKIKTQDRMKYESIGSFFNKDRGFINYSNTGMKTKHIKQNRSSKLCLMTPSIQELSTQPSPNQPMNGFSNIHQNKIQWNDDTQNS